MSGNKSLEERVIVANESSSKFYGVSLIFHALLVLIVIYLNYPAIKQKFNPEPESVAVEFKEKSPAAVPPAALVAETKPEPTRELAKTPTTPAAQPAVKKPAAALTKIRMEEFKEEERLTSQNIKVAEPAQKKTVTRSVTAKPAAKQQGSALPQKKSVEPQKQVAAASDENDSDVLVPKATITEITETAVADELAEANQAETVPAPEVQSPSSSLQQMARSELVEETVEENSSTTIFRTPSLTRPAPTASQIRSVSTLRQRSGNPLPSYSDFERLQRHEGQVTYLAYVTADGRLSDFILAESSGYANLDQKTMQALQGWRFFPGQEGWVEIPQMWILTGEPEQLPSQLRR